jgi:hypothetical protein
MSFFQALLLLATVFVGFARIYYLAGVFHAPLPSLIIHLQGAVFSCWILLLVAQTSLVSAGRVDLHRRLGITGFLLACLMVVMGVLAATDTLLRNGGPPGGDPQAFYIVPMTDMVIFCDADLLCFPLALQFGNSQAPHPNRHHWAVDRRHRPLAHGSSNARPGGADLLHLPAYAAGLRPVVYTQDSSRNTVGGHVRHFRPTDQASPRSHCRLAHFCQLGAGFGALTLQLRSLHRWTPPHRDRRFSSRESEWVPRLQEFPACVYAKQLLPRRHWPDAAPDLPATGAPRSAGRLAILRS